MSRGGGRRTTFASSRRRAFTSRAFTSHGGMMVLQSDGQKVELKAEDIEDVQPSKVSAMPEGLANRLSLEQIADLFAYLTNAPEPSVAGRAAPNVR